MRASRKILVVITSRTAITAIISLFAFLSRPRKLFTFSSEQVLNANHLGS